MLRALQQKCSIDLTIQSQKNDYDIYITKYGRKEDFGASSDDSKHNKTDRHALAFSSPDVNGDPSYKTLSTMPATGKDADSNAEMNFNLFKDKIDPLALVHYGGGVTDNASAAAKERNLVFDADNYSCVSL
jgi:hypothetical protein